MVDNLSEMYLRSSIVELRPFDENVFYARQ